MEAKKRKFQKGRKKKDQKEKGTKYGSKGKQERKNKQTKIEARK